MQRPVSVVMGVLLIAPVVLLVYKLWWLDYALSDVLPQTEYRLQYDMSVDGHGDKVRVRTFLPYSDEHQHVFQESASNGRGLVLAIKDRGMNRQAAWSGNAVPNGTLFGYTLSVQLRAHRYEISSDLPVAKELPRSVAPYLAAEEKIQSAAPEIISELARIAADHGSFTERIRRIYARTRALARRPFKGTTDALTALRLGEASCNGKSRLFVALARAAGIPARLVGGLILTPGSKRTSHQWVEVFIAGHWVPYCPTNGHFAEIPANYLVLYRGDEALFRHTRDINFKYHFIVNARMVPSAQARSSLRGFNVWALFDRLGLPYSLLRTVLMLPFGALVVVLFRNVVGVPTFGTFLPALLAAAAGETGIAWGMVGLLVVLGVVAILRLLLGKLELLHSPTLAILLTGVVITMLATSMVAEHIGLLSLARLSFFPIAVLAIASERFYLALTEQSVMDALKQLGGTLLVVCGCYLVMNSLALQILVSSFPEMLLVVVAVTMYLGRWIGVRLSEYLRFRTILLARKKV